MFPHVHDHSTTATVGYFQSNVHHPAVNTHQMVLLNIVPNQYTIHSHCAQLLKWPL